MKAILLFSIFATLFGDGKDFPEKVKADFKSRFPSVTKVKWERQGVLYEAEFKDGKKEIEVIYSKEGDWLYTVTEMDRRNLPVAILNGFRSSKYADWKLDETGTAEAATGKKMYFMEVAKGQEEYHLILDETGKVVTETQAKAGK